MEEYKGSYMKLNELMNEEKSGVLNEVEQYFMWEVEQLESEEEVKIKKLVKDV